MVCCAKPSLVGVVLGDFCIGIPGHSLSLWQGAICRMALNVLCTAKQQILRMVASIYNMSRNEMNNHADHEYRFLPTCLLPLML